MKLPYIGALAFSLIACSEKPSTEISAKSATATEASISSVIVSEKPAEAVSITELRGSAKTGDTVTFTGKLIGHTTVLVEGHAIMVLGDPMKLTSCDMKPGSTCETPWDVCCDGHDVIKQNIVTVQVVDADGRPLKEGLRGVGGIKELSQVVIQGTVAAGSNEDNMLVNATGIFVEKS